MSGNGPFGIDPLHFTGFLLCCLFLFVLYLLTPKGIRVQYFGAYPKRYAWSARSSRGVSGALRRAGGDPNSYGSPQTNPHPLTGAVGLTHRLNSNGTAGFGGHKSLAAQGIGMNDGRRGGYNGNPDGALSFGGSNPHESHDSSHLQPRASPSETSTHSSSSLNNTNNPHAAASPNEDIVISAAMQQLRDPGVLIIAHGSKGKPKTVRLQLTESAITWRTETRKKDPNSNTAINKIPPKLGKLHQVPLSHIMYVDVGKQTTALRRVENAHVMEELCFSLLTKEGSLDLEANSARERDALVSCFSLVLDEVHAANWRDIYRGPSSDMPSSFDDFDTTPHNFGPSSAAGHSSHHRGDSRV